MALIKVKSPVIKTVPGPPGPPGKDGNPGKVGKPGKDGITTVITEVVEKAVDLTTLQSQLIELSDKFEWLKKRKTERVGAGSQPTKYMYTELQEVRYKKGSFIEGFNIIGVRFNGAASIYLPRNLEPTQIVAIKDEVGSGDITVRID
jgi:hypothetical protein